MHKTYSLLIEKCQVLRSRGFSLGKIIKLTKLPKTTVFEHIREIPLSPERKKEIQKQAIKRLAKFSRLKKGKCLFGRVVIKPEGWSPDLIFLTAHFMFDGEIRHSRCVYQNRNSSLIKKVKCLMYSIFNLNSYDKFYRESGVYRISYHHVELAGYLRKKSRELKQYIKTTISSEKRIFLQAFFDDEGCVYKCGNNRKIRGYQDNLEVLRLIERLLKDFNMNSRIEEKGKEIVISGKENLIKFRDKINFSKGVKINGKRKNSTWKKDLEKRRILEMIITSYKPAGTPGVHH